jgi:3-oxoacyl-[acyl-carrier-protein] synthase III
MSGLYLHGMGHFHPENVITNRFLEELDIGTTEDWIVERVGIRSRRTVLSLDYIRQTKNQDPRAAFEASQYSNAQLGAAAARMAIQRAGIKLEDIGLMILGNSAIDNIAPAEASAVAAELGVDIPCFDMNSACSTFGTQITFLNGMRPDALPSFVLLVNPESISRRIDYSDRSSAIIFGDGSAAAVLSATVPSRAAFSSCHFDCKPTEWEKVGISWNGFFHQDGNAVQGFAIRKMTESLRLLKDQYNVNGHPFRFIGHQANLSALQTVCERLSIPEEHHWHNVGDFGNTACAGAPTVLSQRWDDLRPGHRVAISVAGAGLSWAHMMLEVEGS